MKRLLILCSVFCILCSVSQGAQVIRYVDPDAAGAGNGTSWADAYTSLFAWEAAEQTNLVTAGNYHTVYCRSSGGTADTTILTILGWTTDATHYVEIIGSDFPADGIWDDTKYVLHNNNSSGTGIINSQIDYVYYINLQFKVTQTVANARMGLYINAGVIAYVDSCIFKGVCSGTGANRGILIDDFGITVYIYNSIFYDFVSGADLDYEGIFHYNSGSGGPVYIYNCTVYNCGEGIVTTSSSGQPYIYNCAVGNCVNDFTGSWVTLSNCCSDDGDGTNPQGPLGGNWANEFTTPGTDFSLLAGGNCVGNGTDDPGAGLYSDDIIGTARSSIWDIGAFEYSGAPPPAGGGQVIIVGKL